MNFQSCWDLSLLLSTWFFTLPSLVYFAPIVDVHLVIFSVNHPWKHLEANLRGRRCVTLQKIFILLTLSVCVCSFWILSTQYIRYCKIPLTGVWQSHLGDGKTFQLKTVKIWPHEVNTFSYVIKCLFQRRSGNNKMMLSKDKLPSCCYTAVKIFPFDSGLTTGWQQAK